MPGYTIKNLMDIDDSASGRAQGSRRASRAATSTPSTSA